MTLLPLIPPAFTFPLPVRVYTDPTGPIDPPSYRVRTDFTDADLVPLVLDGVEVGRIPVRDLLP